MATASKITEDVEVVTVERRETGVSLMLSTEEAQMLRDVAYRTGGDPRRSRRGLMDSIGRELHDLGFHSEWAGSDVDRGLHFKDSK